MKTKKPTTIKPLLRGSVAGKIIEWSEASGESVNEVMQRLCQWAIRFHLDTSASESTGFYRWLDASTEAKRGEEAMLRELKEAKEIAGKALE